MKIPLPGTSIFFWCGGALGIGAVSSTLAALAAKNQLIPAKTALKMVNPISNALCSNFPSE